MSTSRLKKAIENSDNNGFGNLLESFVTYGTPLPDLTSKKDTNEFVPLHLQEVVDEKGRKRLHGAFTGGFSAGYFNTVGSKEGWTPSTFKSSRAVRATPNGQGVSDAAAAFMDDEDLADLALSRTLQTSSEYSVPSTAYDPLMGNVEASNSSIPSSTAALASLIEPSTSRVGAKLMRKMGWRDGQGVGPRVTIEQRRKQAFELGIKIDKEVDDGSEESTKHYYAPLDRPLASLKEVGISTDKGWGLGYKAGPNVATLMKGENQSGGNSTARPTAFDDDDEDEDDVYSGGSNMTTLDSREKKRWGIVDLDEERDNYRISSSSSSRQTKAIPARSKGSGQTFHDGTPVLVGFSLNEERTPIPSTSQLPIPPPKDWKPNPQRIWDEAENVNVNANEKGKGKQLNADDRGSLLGEEQPPPLPKSVFEYLSSKNKERLANLNNLTFTNTNSTSNSASSSNNTPLGNARMNIPSIPEPDVALIIPTLDGPTALAALKGFQPFSNSSTSPDPMRQARYTLYLQFQANLLPPSNSTLPFGPRKFSNNSIQTISELNKELDDYAKAAKVFKPVTGMLAGRFTSGGSGTVLPVTAAIPGFYQPAPKLPSTSSTALEENSEPERLTSAQIAVRNDMFGDETRTIVTWKPARLICKRFSVPVPYPLDSEGGSGGGEEGEEEIVVGGAWKEAGSYKNDWGKRTGAGEVLGKASMEALMQSSGFRKLQSTPSTNNNNNEEDYETSARNGSSNQEQSKSSISKPVVRSADAPSLANIGLGDDEAQGAETLTYTKAPKDIFAAIFADSDDEDEEDSDEDEVTESKEVVAIEPAKSNSIATANNLPPTTILSSSRDGAVILKDSIEESNVTLDSITISNYKPNFIPTSARTTKDETNTTTSKEEKSKKKKRKAPKATLSFDVDDGEENEEVATVVKKSVKKVKLEKKVVEVVQEVEEEVWEEAKSVVHPSISKITEANNTNNNNNVGKRARASDLY